MLFTSVSNTINRMYLGAIEGSFGNFRLNIYNIEQPNNPILLNDSQINLFPGNINLAYPILYIVSNYDQKLQIYNVFQDEIIEKGSYNFEANIFDAAIKTDDNPTGSRAFIAAYGMGLYAMNVIDKDEISILAQNYNQNPLKIMKGKDDASFELVNQYLFDIGSIPSDITLGNFNNSDNKWDFAIADYGLNQIITYLGNGYGGFSSHPHKLNEKPYKLLSGDFNNDSYLDIVFISNESFPWGINEKGKQFGAIEKELFNLTENQGFYLHFLPGNGNGTYGNIISSECIRFPDDIAAADINGDGLPNITVIDSYSGKIEFLLNDLHNAGHFIRVNIVSVTWPTAIMLDDLTGDGKIDAAVAALAAENSRENDLIIFTDLDGSIREVHRSPISQIPILKLSSADITNNGKRDIIYSHSMPTSVSIMHNIKAESIAAIVRYNNLPLWIQAKMGIEKISGGYIDQDNYIDLIGYNLANKFEYFQNIKDTFKSKCEAELDHVGTVGGFELINFDNDAFSELLVSDSKEGKFKIVLSKLDENCIFKYLDSIELENMPDKPLRIDFDKDGDEDIALLMVNPDTQNFENIWIIENKLDGFLHIKQTISLGYYTAGHLVKGDFNADGYNDIAAGVWDKETNQYLIIMYADVNHDGYFEFYAKYITQVPVSAITSGDFNADGFSDIAYGYAHLSFLYVVFNIEGTFPPSSDIKLYTFPPIKLFSLDANFDNIDDLLVMEECIFFLDSSEGCSGKSFQPATISLFLSRGNNSFRKESDYLVSNDPNDAYIADFNNDGRPDIAVGSTSNFMPDDPQAITILYNHFPYPKSESVIPYQLCTPAENEPIVIKGKNFQNPEVYIGNYKIEIDSFTHNKIEGTITIPERISANTFIKVINHIYDSEFEDIIENAVMFGARPKIYSLSPVSIPASGNVIIQVNGEGFISGQTKVILHALTSEGEWNPVIEANVDPSGNILWFMAPSTPNLEALIATVCIKNENCKEECLIESLGYYNAENQKYPFTPQIGTTSGYTPVTFYVIDVAPVPLFCKVKFDDIPAVITYNQNGKLIALTPSHSFSYVNITLCYCLNPNICITLDKNYEFSNFAYLTGSLQHLEVIDTDEDKLVDFHPYMPGIQSQIEINSIARSSAFSLKSPSTNYPIPGRFSYVITASTVIKLDTGSNEIIATGPPLFPPQLPSSIYNDVGMAIMQNSNIVVIASEELVDLPYPGPRAGIVTLNADTLQIIDQEAVPDLASATTINIRMDGNIAYITAIGSNGLPNHQTMAVTHIDPYSGQITIMDTFHTNYQVSNIENIYNIGLDLLKDKCTQNTYYNCLFYVAPEANELDVINFGECQCPYPNASEHLSMPQDVAIGKIRIKLNTYQWRAFIVNSTLDKNNSLIDKWTMIRDIESDPKPEKAQDTRGITPVACALRKSENINKNNDKLYIVNMNSIDALGKYDVSVVNPSLNEVIRRISEISDEFHPHTISIQKVLSTRDFLEADRTIIQQMPDSDFTTPSKKQVLLNRLNTIENLLETPANNQAIISNTEAFKNQVDNFVVNEEKKESLIALADALIKSLD